MTSHAFRTNIRMFLSPNQITAIVLAFTCLCANGQDAEREPRSTPLQGPVPQQQRDLFPPNKLNITGDIEGKLVRLTVDAFFEVE